MEAEIIKEKWFRFYRSVKAHLLDENGNTLCGQTNKYTYECTYLIPSIKCKKCLKNGSKKRSKYICYKKIENEKSQYLKL